VKERAKIGGGAKRRKRWVLLWAQACVCPACDRIMNPGLHWNDPEYPTLDHVEAHSAGGANALSNLLVKHRACNERRADAPATPQDIEALARVQARLTSRPRLIAECKAQAKALYAAAAMVDRRAA
jgi:hypothetical protein